MLPFPLKIAKTKARKQPPRPVKVVVENTNKAARPMARLKRTKQWPPRPRASVVENPKLKKNMMVRV